MKFRALACCMRCRYYSGKAEKDADTCTYEPFERRPRHCEIVKQIKKEGYGRKRR